MKLTATQFRHDLYKTLDRLVETGETLEIQRKGALLRLQVEPAAGALVDPDRFAHRRHLLKVPASDLVAVDWSQLWRPDGGFDEPGPKRSKPRSRAGAKKRAKR